MWHGRPYLYDGLKPANSQNIIQKSFLRTVKDYMPITLFLTDLHLTSKCFIIST